jgi:hypothetical protein
MLASFFFSLITSGLGLCEIIFSIPHKVLTDQINVMFNFLVYAILPLVTNFFYFKNNPHQLCIRINLEILNLITPRVMSR